MNLYRGTRLWLAALAATALVAGMAAPAAAAPPNRTQTPAITAKPVSPTRVTTATFTFASSTAGAIYTCQLDAGAASTCTSPWTYSGITNGAHTFSVKAQAPGLKLSGTATATWTVDTVAPNAPAVTGPAAVTRVTNPAPTFSSTSPDVVGYVCSLDGAPDTPCTSGSVLTVATEGAHTFSVHAKDAVGNLSAPTAIGWTLDTTVSRPYVLSGPATLTNATTATFGFGSADADATLECKLDTGAFAPCTSPVTYNDLVPAAHQFQVRATDPVGNVQQLLAPFAWTVGVTPLSFAWTDPASLPSGVSSSRTATFDFAVSGQTTLDCFVDGVLHSSSCLTPVVLTDLSEGLHTFALTADDGLVTESTISFTWEVDVTAPAAPTISAPQGWVASSTASVVVTAANASDKLTCIVDSVVTPCSTSVPIDLTGLSEGLHVVVATAADKAGNLGQQQAVWNVDTLAPVATVTSPTTLTGSVSVAFDDEVTGGDTNPALELVDGTAVATTRVCRDGSGVQVSCTTAARRVVLTPVSPLVPGQSYVVSVNKAGTAPVVDLAGNPAASSTRVFRAALSAQENSPVVTQTWRTVSASGARGASYVTDSQTGARSSWTFTGTSITVYPVSGPAFGYVTVYVDGVKKASWNQYATTTRYTSARSITGLTNAKHVVSFVVAGKKGSTKATGWAVGIDAVKVGSTLTTAPKMSYAWARVKGVNASGLYKSVAVQKSQVLSMSFVGTSVAWIHSVGKNHGKAEVWIDGVKKATVDLYATSSKDGVVWKISGLTAGKHSIRIAATGTKRTGATGTLVSVDRFLVG